MSLPRPKRLFNILEAVLAPEGFPMQPERPDSLPGSVLFLQSDVFRCVQQNHVTCTHPASRQKRDGKTSEAEEKELHVIDSPALR